jgi:hypothetical protein
MRCLFCHREGQTFPVKSWNNDQVKYYCKDHYRQVYNTEQNEKERFYEYYRDPLKFEWLNQRQKELYKKIRREFES